MKAKKILYIALILILLAVFSVSAFEVGSYYFESKQRSDLYSDLAATVENARKVKVNKAEQEAPTEPQVEENTEPQILPEYQELYDRNPDLVGWIYMENTAVNYPVMMKPEDPDFYLKRNFDGKYDAGGCIYIKVGDPYLPSDNLTLYGHNMGDGSMFGDLVRYEHQNYVDKHKYIQFDTLYEHHTYEIFSVFVTTATVGKGFRYHTVVDLDTQEDFDEFVSGCKRRSLVDTGVTPVYGDKLICLSTCEYSNINGRLVVAAVRVD